MVSIFLPLLLFRVLLMVVAAAATAAVLSVRYSDSAS
ncbi:hypothetical protein A2U01_0066558 [Trifolium medium]|uniref:Uncharacterized protein n=1 Tax=Trifolium medium TaxID=97028 RepID=A0A392S9F5_9FABA|nr:hypothetical protein [Trifolium medium]